MTSFSSISDKIRSPFKLATKRPFKGADFPGGFRIEELQGPKTIITLVGNQLPLQTFDFGGKQRISKEFYSGDSEPVVHVLGPEESDQTIRGELKDIKFTGPGVPGKPDLTGASYELQKLLDSVRIRGNLCKFNLGEWQRFGFIEQTRWGIKTLSRIKYEIDLSIVGFNRPKNAKFQGESKEIPVSINESLIGQAAKFNSSAKLFAPSIPQSIGDAINELTGAIASAISILTDFVDTIFSTIRDIKKAIERAKGLIKHAINRIKDYKRQMNALFQDPFNTSSSLTGVYANSTYFSSQTTAAQSLSSTLVGFRAQFINILPTLPIGRHLVKQGDTIQAIAVKFYEDSANWKKILDFNNLTDPVLVRGAILEIPRL